MRRLLPLLVALPAIAAPAAAAETTTSSGRITTLTPSRIAIAGSRLVSCRIGPDSPPLTQGFAVGRQVVISCREGLLTGIRPAALAPVPAPGPATTVSSASAHSSASGRPVTSTDLVGKNVTITALDPTSITVAAGSVQVSCRLAAASPSLTGYRAGERVARVECQNGRLTTIVHS